MKKTSYLRKGAALIVVMLIILAATTLALFSMQIMQSEDRVSSAFRFNRQSARAAHEMSYLIQNQANNQAGSLCAEQKNQAITQSIQSGSFVSQDAINSTIIDQNTILDFTGLSNIQANPNNNNNNPRLRGDLSRPFSLAATLGNFTMTSEQVEGFSDPDAFQSFNMSGDSYALIGQPAMLRGTAPQQYYLLSDINANVSGFKREFGIYKSSPISCQ